MVQQREETTQVDRGEGGELQGAVLPLKKVCLLLGFILLALGLWILRYPQSAPSFLQHNLGLPLPAWRLGFPSTFAPACLLMLIGLLGLGLGTKSPPDERLDRPPEPVPAYFGSRPWGLFFWLQGAGLICLLLAALEYTGVLSKFPAAPYLWVAVLVWGAVYLRRLDRRRQIRLQWELSGREWLFLLVASVAGLCYWLYDVAAWKYIMVGDEYGFLWAARSLAAQPWWQWNPLEASGVYGDNPVMNTVILALFLKVFGASAFSWNLSGAALMMVGLPFLYIFARSEWNQTTGVIASVVYICSVLVTAHAKIGYPNGAMILPIVLTLSFLVLARRGSALYAYLAGLGAGFGVFLVMVGWLVASAFLGAVLILELARSQHKRRVITKISLATAGWLLGAFPILIQVDYFNHLFDKNVSQKLTNEGMVVNSVKAFLAFLSFHSPSRHYVYGEAADILTALLIVSGLAFAIIHRKGKILILLACSIFFTSTISKYQYLPLTRFHVIAIAWAVLAGLGAAWLLRMLPHRRLRLAALVSMIAVISILNLRAWRSLENWLITDVHYVAHYFEVISQRTRGIHLVPERWNLETENEGMQLAGIDVRAVKDSDISGFLDSGIRQSPENWVVFIQSSAILPKLSVDFLVNHDVPVFLSRAGRYHSLEMNPQPLSSQEIREFDRPRPRPSPGRPKNPAELEFVDNRISIYGGFVAGEGRFPGFWLSCYDKPYWNGALTCGEPADTILLPGRKARRIRDYSALWTGLFEPPENGEYEFSITSDDGSFLILNGQFLLDNLGPHPKKTVTDTVQLAAGRPVLLEVGYFQLGGDASMEFSARLISGTGLDVEKDITQFFHTESMRQR